MPGKTLAEQIGNRCVHFNGIQSKKCRAGVAYASVEGEIVPYRRNLPCFKDAGPNKGCEHCRFPTPDEIQQVVSGLEAASRNGAAARAAVVRHIRAGAGRSGECECPVCHGRLSYSQASNGHLVVKCGTPSCVAFME